MFVKHYREVRGFNNLPSARWRQFWDTISIKLKLSYRWGKKYQQVISQNHFVTLLSDISIFVWASWWGRRKVRICGVVVRYWQTSLIISIQSSGHLEHLFVDQWARKILNLARWPPHRNFKCVFRNELYFLHELLILPYSDDVGCSKNTVLHLRPLAPRNRLSSGWTGLKG